MVTISFCLKNPNASESLINVFVYFRDGKPLKYSTSIQVPTQFWNKDTHRVREVREYHLSKIINKRLDLFESTIKEISLSTNSPNASYVRERLNELFRPGAQAGDQDNSFLGVYRRYIERNLEKSNIKSYRSTYNAINKLMPKSISIEAVTYDYLDTFKLKLEKTVIMSGKSKGRYPSVNHIATMIKNIKAVLNDARKRGFTVDASIKDFTKEQEEHDSIYLTPDEVLKIYNTVVPESYQKTKALFIVGCYTAMRFSDYSELSQDNIKNGLIYKIPQKTKNSVVVPIHPIALEILKRYNYNLPGISNSILNRQIKEIAKLAGINEKVSVTRSQGGKIYVEVKEKWELVTTHTARRSGATNMYLAGIPSISIMMITGHKTERAFMKYIKVTKEQNAQILANHEFFKI